MGGKFKFYAQGSDLAPFDGNGTKIKIPSEIKGGGMLRFWNVLVLVLNFESIFCDLLAWFSLVNKNGCKGKH